ncbi:hypothetical protein ACFL1S_04875 [Pseudomonadota bacterium]
MGQSRVLIYGRVLKGISITVDDLSDGLGFNKLLRNQFGPEDASGDSKPRLAAIYGFEFEGHYYDLASPTVLLVHGSGTTPKKAGAIVESDPKLADDVKVWPYDKADFSMRIDIDSGPLESILLEQALDDEELAAEMSGKRVSGKRVSGKRVSGKRVSGKRMSGD